jgi:iron complex transport system permease protein
MGTDRAVLGKFRSRDEGSDVQMRGVDCHAFQVDNTFEIDEGVDRLGLSAQNRSKPGSACKEPRVRREAFDQYQSFSEKIRLKVLHAEPRASCGHPPVPTQGRDRRTRARRVASRGSGDREAGASPARSRHCDRGAAGNATFPGRGREGAGKDALIRESGDLPDRDTTQSPLRAKEVAAVQIGLRPVGARHTPRPRPRRVVVPFPTPRTKLLRLAVLAAALVVTLLAGACAGSLRVPPGQVILALLHPHAQGLIHEIVWQLRLPRVLAAAAVGGGLGVAGAMLQMLFRNPLVDPYITGVSAGAALAASVGILSGVTFTLVPGLAFAGGLACAGIVAWIGMAGTGGNNLRLVLAGVAVSALASAVITLLLLWRGGQNVSLLGWLAGGIETQSWHQAGLVAAYLAAGLAAAFLLVRDLNLLRLGTAAAAGFGLPVEIARLRVLVVASLITAACVAASGIVGFVGLIVPHGVRRVLGGDARWLLAGCALAGSCVVVAADLLARSLFPPIEIPLGVLLAFVGVPFFLAIARRPVDV